MKVNKEKVNLKEVKKIFFIGVGGVGISALAKLVLDRGYKISAINDSASKETLNELREKGVEIILGNDTEEFQNFDLIIYSVAWEQRAPELMKKVFESEIPVINYFEGLSIFTKEFPTVAVAGTHGKTTTTGMIKKAFENTDFDFNTIVGSILSQNGSNYLKGKSDWFLVEACEYKRHFLHLNPKIAVITNIEADHLDYYKDLDDILAAFLEFANKAEVLILNKNDENIKKILPKINSKIIDYSPFVEEVRKMNLKVIGEHNFLNGAVVLALAKYFGVDILEVKKGLKNFSGTWRRFEFIGEFQSGGKIYTDYAHHPTEIKATLNGVKGKFKKVFVIFEPHTFSRTKALADEFGGAFQDADEIYITPIYPAREEALPGIDNNFLVEKIKKNNPNVFAKTFKEAFEEVKNKISKDDVLMVLGAGDIYFDLKEIL